MKKPRLLVVCGVPGSGKSTLSLRAANRWGAVRFASETFAEELGASSRTASGDLSKEAIAHSYAAMGAAARDALAKHIGLTVVVGAFRSEELRRLFRDIAKNAGANVTTLRIVCSDETAAKRIRTRLAFGERGPTKETIQQIGAELDHASDIDTVLTNNLSLGYFYQKVDAIIRVVNFFSENEGSTGETKRRLEQLRMDGVDFAGELLDEKSRSKRFDAIVRPRDVSQRTLNPRLIRR